MMSRLDLGPVSVEASGEWLDITDDVGSDAPLTIAKNDGVGALQVTAATFRAGAKPAPTPDTLEKMVLDFGKRHGQTVFDLETGRGVSDYSALSIQTGDDFVRAWYLTNGTDFCLVTYTCRWGAQHLELSEVSRIVSSLSFK
jgi:hypothetical protein